LLSTEKDFRSGSTITVETILRYVDSTVTMLCHLRLMGKWLQILKEAAPGLRRAALMIHIGNAASPIWYRMFNDVAPTLAIEPISAPIRDQNEIEGVIKSMAAQPNSALLVAGDNLVSDPPVRRLIIDLAATYRLPALYGELPFALDGGLISYGIDRIDQFKRAASYVDRILKGERPSDLPVQQPTKFDFVVNLKTAKALGLELPLTLQMTADEDPLLGVKRTSRFQGVMSAFDQKRT
jgi:putative tryptophan/tyrosine transport system substrate-binding protein